MGVSIDMKLYQFMRPCLQFRTTADLLGQLQNDLQEASKALKATLTMNYYVNNLLMRGNLRLGVLEAEKCKRKCRITGTATGSVAQKDRRLKSSDTETDTTEVDEQNLQNGRSHIECRTM